eukprot:COSAG02_NODE_1296_length_13393_cov_15.825109_13_plen_157_part_00
MLRPKSSRAEELLDLPVDLPKSSSTWALIRRALRPSVKSPESSQAAGRPGRRALRPPLTPSELSVWLSVTEELTAGSRVICACDSGETWLLSLPTCPIRMSRYNVRPYVRPQRHAHPLPPPQTQPAPSPPLAAADQYGNLTAIDRVHDRVERDEWE